MFGSRKDELMRDGSFESDYNIPSTTVAASKDAFINVDEINLRKLEKKVDSVVDWIHQFYDRFRYLDEEVGTIKGDVTANKEMVGNMMQSGGDNSSIKVLTDIDKLETDMKVLAQRIEANKVFIESNSKGDDSAHLKNAQMNELSRMSDTVNVNVNRSKAILDEIKTMFLEIKGIKDKLENVAARKVAASPESKIRAALNSHKDIVVERARLNVDSQYKKLDEDKEKKSGVSHPVGSREWLREVKGR